MNCSERGCRLPLLYFAQTVQVSPDDLLHEAHNAEAPSRRLEIAVPGRSSFRRAFRGSQVGRARDETQIARLRAGLDNSRRPHVCVECALQRRAVRFLECRNTTTTTTRGSRVGKLYGVYQNTTRDISVLAD